MRTEHAKVEHQRKQTISWKLLLLYAVCLVGGWGFIWFLVSTGGTSAYQYQIRDLQDDVKKLELKIADVGRNSAEADRIICERMSSIQQGFEHLKQRADMQRSDMQRLQAANDQLATRVAELQHGADAWDRWAMEYESWHKRTYGR